MLRTRMLATLTLSALLLPGVALADFVGGVQQGVDKAGAPAGFSPGGATLPVIVGNVIGVALSLVGVLLLVTLLYAGFLYMTAGGNTDNVKKAKGMIVNSIIGLIIVASSYAIASFVLTSIISSATGGGGVANSSPQG